jgi:hypothetical protein
MVVRVFSRQTFADCRLGEFVVSGNEGERRESVDDELAVNFQSGC